MHELCKPYSSCTYNVNESNLTVGFILGILQSVNPSETYLKRSVNVANGLGHVYEQSFQHEGPLTNRLDKRKIFIKPFM